NRRFPLIEPPRDKLEDRLHKCRRHGLLPYTTEPLLDLEADQVLDVILRGPDQPREQIIKVRLEEAAMILSLGKCHDWQGRTPILANLALASPRRSPGIPESLEPPPVMRCPSGPWLRASIARRRSTRREAD